MIKTAMISAMIYLLSNGSDVSQFASRFLHDMSEVIDERPITDQEIEGVFAKNRRYATLDRPCAVFGDFPNHQKPLLSPISCQEALSKAEELQRSTNCSDLRVSTMGIARPARFFYWVQPEYITQYTYFDSLSVSEVIHVLKYVMRYTNTLQRDGTEHAKSNAFVNFSTKINDVFRYHGNIHPSAAHSSCMVQSYDVMQLQDNGKEPLLFTINMSAKCPEAAKRLQRNYGMFIDLAGPVKRLKVCKLSADGDGHEGVTRMSCAEFNTNSFLSAVKIIEEADKQAKG